MAFADLFVCFLIALSISSAAADSIYGCGGFVEVRRSFASKHLIESFRRLILHLIPLFSQLLVMFGVFVVLLGELSVDQGEKSF